MSAPSSLFHIHFLFLILIVNLAILSCINGPASGRNPLTDADDLSQMIMLLAEGLDPGDFENDAAFEEYLTELAELYPVDLNQASVSELRQIPVITTEIVHSIEEFRLEQPFSSIEDLLLVPGIGPVTLQNLRPWVTVSEEQRTPLPILSQISAQQLFRIQYLTPTAEGYRGRNGASPHYAGSPARIYHRQSVRGNRFSGNLTQVKLPGEPIHHTLLFDFTSAHAAVEDIGLLRQLVIGDYSLRFGQGLVLWNTPAFGKGGAAHTAPLRRGTGITPYRSSGQSRFLRGIAAEISLPLPWSLSHRDAPVTISSFYSKRRRTAIEVSGDTIRPPTSNPYHRTEAELLRRNNTAETIYGGNITTHSRYGQLGFTYYEYQTDRPVLPVSSSTGLQGQNNRTMSTDILIHISNISLFGEYAIRPPSRGGSIAKNTPAWIAGLKFDPRDTFNWIFTYRSYHPGYWSEFGNGFGEGTGVPSNQSGWYFGFRIRPSPALTISGFFDRFLFPAPRRGLTRPSDGWEPSVRLHYRRSPDMNFQIQLKHKARPAEVAMHDAYMRTYRLTHTDSRTTGRFRVHWQYRQNMVWQTRLDVSRSGSHPESKNTGVAVTQLFRWRVFRSMRFDLNWSFFDTGDFSSRIYLYEYDLTYAFSSAMVYGTGQRSYAVIRYQPAEWLLLEGKAGYIRYYDRTAMGTGHNLVPGPSRTDFGLQLRIKY